MTAREYFAGVEREAKAHRRAELLLEFGPPTGGARGGKGPADPVQARFESDQRARAELERTGAAIGEALERIEAIRGLFGRKADVLEMRYIDLLAWDEIAHEFAVSIRTAYNWRNVLCDWADSFGWARAMSGSGTAQE